MTDIIMVGLVGIMGYYVLASGVLTGQTQTTTPAPTTYTTPAPVAPTALPSLQTQCDTEGGKWQGSCCSCPNANCTEKCGSDENKEFDVVDACESEDGLWQTNRNPQCCSCPNKDCSFKCGKIKKTPSGGEVGTISEDEKARGLCISETGDADNWNPKAKCCTCSGTCRNKCRTSTVSSKGSGKASPGVTPKKPAPKGAVTLKKPAPKPCAAKCAPLKNSPATYKSCCASNYARSYLAGSSNRRGPSYTGRDDYRHYTGVEFPSPVDFEYESVARPNWLGPVSPERHSLIRRFQSNFGTMRFSG